MYLIVFEEFGLLCLICEKKAFDMLKKKNPENKSLTKKDNRWKKKGKSVSLYSLSKREQWAKQALSSDRPSALWLQSYALFKLERYWWENQKRRKRSVL